ncbi:PREDICTED: ankyrin repeat and SOCS box protein 18 [Elephantulus edwardii]|uniref:ankyrin repeat and SOCS box protein 18 n=1 Tax=Elephantulus edwardii TaxID=28737 RepID=UPI0003F093BA|nr:PREDICTED: ankyrin repeat and SOCS box protein 18 [Elephantulus edwardii]
MSNSDYLPDYPLNSDFVKRLKAALDTGDEGRVASLICSEVQHVDAVIELSNDDWMKDPAAQLPTGVLTGDLSHLQLLMDQFFQDANVVIEIHSDEMEWQVKSPATFGLSGLWTLEYKRELTTPLCLAAARGRTACLHHLLTQGAHPDSSPGGRSALHEACLGGHTACARLLLHHHAHPDLLDADGLAPLHLCRTAASLGCAEALLEHRASVQLDGGPARDTPLHVAAQHGLDDHVRLYLSHGARVDTRNGRGETALSAACGVAWRPEEHARSLRLCALLLQHGADADARDEDERSPLHKACGRVLQTCASTPTVIEVLFNSYPQLHVSESWKGVIPEEELQMHQPFYQSLFALASTPRCLQHQSRCAIRKLLGKKCSLLVPRLPLPKALRDYLLLEPEGLLR